jgi:diaminohydroxyphosphoribosylaminopyrimidine deaminase/5-amino-6-(5-phosphoribosylamino)uracil reductase
VQSVQQNPEQTLWIFCGPDADSTRRANLEALGIRVTVVDAQPALDLPEILHHLHAARILRILLEAGSDLNGAFLRHDLVDEVILYYAETELGPAALPFATGTDGPFALEQRLLSVSKRLVGPDVRVSGLLHNPWPKSTDFG